MPTPQQILRNKTTDELKSMLVIRRFLQGYFKNSKSPEFWVKAVLEVEEELRKRGALE